MQKYPDVEKKQLELDSILSVIDNSVRRDIIKRLSQESSYPLQLSKELGIGQQLIAKHLGVLERAGIVASSMETSPSGPKRKEYALKKSVALSINFAPNLFTSSLIDLTADNSEDLGVTKETISLGNRLEKIINSSKGDEDRISSIGRVISDVDKQIEELEEEKTALLFIRNLAMDEAAKRIKKSEKSTDTRRIMYHILDSHSKNVSKISESVNLREEVVRKLLDSLQNELNY